MSVGQEKHKIQYCGSSAGKYGLVCSESIISEALSRFINTSRVQKTCYFFLRANRFDSRKVLFYKVLLNYKRNIRKQEKNTFFVFDKFSS